MTNKTILLYFGSFNPPHLGHLIIAEQAREITKAHQTWLVVSPHNPHKNPKDLLPVAQRVELIKKAIRGNKHLLINQAELSLPQPSYTINTLHFLNQTYPELKYEILIGEDNLEKFHTWKNYEEIINNYSIWVYPRPQAKAMANPEHEAKIKKLHLPLIDISSTQIRKRISEGKSIKYLVTSGVEKIF
ncbi:MAG: nicotinate-nucleotide adenylyltransferase [Sphingobacteriales bacterium]|nr:nicotinate-nucleotide adenylyltransferase [Sphingobacteriales bacterium]